MLRIFIAIEISKRQIEEVSELQHELKKYIKGVRWVRPEGMHLTLKFLGHAEEQIIDQVKEVLDESLCKIPVFSLQFGGSGVFPTPAKARVLWLGVKAGSELTGIMADNLNSKLTSLGFPADQRKFHPHLTLGRLRYPEPVPVIKSFLEDKKQFQTSVAEIEKVTLFQSILTGSGAQYKALYCSPLSKGK